MLHHPGYFLIYDKKFRYCIFDGIYLKFENVARSARDRQKRGFGTSYGE